MNVIQPEGFAVEDGKAVASADNDFLVGSFDLCGRAIEKLSVHELLNIGANAISKLDLIVPTS